MQKNKWTLILMPLMILGLLVYGITFAKNTSKGIFIQSKLPPKITQLKFALPGDSAPEVDYDTSKVDKSEIKRNAKVYKSLDSGFNLSYVKEISQKINIKGESKPDIEGRGLE